MVSLSFYRTRLPFENYDRSNNKNKIFHRKTMHALGWSLSSKNQKHHGYNLKKKDKLSPNLSLPH